MLVIGHRGDRLKFGDNTIEGIASAFERGADGVEIDVYFRPKKGVYLTHKYLHDPGKDYPLLEEVLRKFAKKGRLQIEIKSPELEAVRAVVDLIKKHHIVNYELTSSIYPLVKHMREMLPKAKVGLLAHQLVQDWWTEEFGDNFLTSYLKLTGADGIHIGQPEGFWNKKRVKRFHDMKYRVCAHLPTNSKEDYNKQVSFGIDSSTSDDLDVLKWKQ